MVLSFLPVDVSDIEKKNDRFAVDLDGQEFVFEVYWNQVGKIFTFNMYDYEDNPIILGRKISYGIDLLNNIVDERLPNIKIIPLDKSEKANKTGITFENFMNPVKLYILEGDNDA